MVVYAEYLFLENLFTGCLILSLTKKIGGLSAGRIRILMGGALCGLYSFVLFLPNLSSPEALLSKLIFSAAVILVVFGRDTPGRFGKTILVFYLVSFAMGGITVGLMYFFGVPGVSGNTSLYIEGVTYLQVVSGCVAAYAGLSLFAGFLKERLLTQKTSAQVEIRIGERTVRLAALVDTGNFLTDPMTGRPVLLVEAEALKSLVSEEGKPIGDLASRFSLIPFHSAGASSGLMTGIRPDRVTIFSGEGTGGMGTKELKNVIIGVYKGTFQRDWNGIHYEMLLHPMVLEGGIVSHA